MEPWRIKSLPPEMMEEVLGFIPATLLTLKRMEDDSLAARSRVKVVAYSKEERGNIRISYTLLRKFPRVEEVRTYIVEPMSMEELVHMARNKYLRFADVDLKELTFALIRDGELTREEGENPLIGIFIDERNKLQPIKDCTQAIEEDKKFSFKLSGITFGNTHLRIPRNYFPLDIIKERNFLRSIEINKVFRGTAEKLLLFPCLERVILIREQRITPEIVIYLEENGLDVLLD